MTVAVKDYLQVVKELNDWFALDVIKRDKEGGVAKTQKDAIREAGLLHLLTPKEYGGAGEKWSTVLRLVREFAKVDPSVAHLYGYHFLQLVAPHMSSSKEQKAFYYSESVKNNWFWGNAFNPLERKLIASKDGDRLILNGSKTFSTGSQDADVLLVSWVTEVGEANVTDTVSGAAVIPLPRKGVTVHHNWDGIGQRQTESGSVTFDNVAVELHEQLDYVYENKSHFSKLSAVLSQIILANVFAGIAEGAITSARDYTKYKSRPWIQSNVQEASEDPYILHSYGEFYIKLQAAISLVEKANEKVDSIWHKDHQLTENERGNCALLTSSANAFAGELALEVSNGIFAVMGARSATTSNGFDRFWRNARTHTLHNPVSYKKKNIGNWFLNGAYPKPGAYS
ncbi:acyl-CoA dehydrogenase family protein [Bacillus sp. FJAT-50079]|uniref:acyl-CoA dehydrogenase family protein n=1 Tax=Bacillus sp. FJAT-50079 TaxID=2833577 RepID=UPI001BCA657A|nr:acyl-CoA dehydrogenase family protein [Bacillus sp. FJAT-50079]MBS4206530.1 acyl-CoA dehydrogenase family protein [Bacillus sp. FJAT-50079]